ncbi:four helix bundle protein [Taibaiella koreensis]|uniref:four helix bundle protein n=1 Tax=Taibaiella koreensis TaxID=1268548 RepID=UPI001F09FFF1|nr:four helix bundle protein [Taibaiella koreensis]
MKIWNKAIDICVDVYKATAHFPPTETYGLTAQIRRSSASIPSNIAEGAGRNSNKEFIHFLGIATGSAYELQTQVIISEKLHLINAEQSEYLTHNINELLKMTYAFKENIKNRTL